MTEGLLKRAKCDDPGRSVTSQGPATREHSAPAASLHRLLSADEALAPRELALRNLAGTPRCEALAVQRTPSHHHPPQGCFLLIACVVVCMPLYVVASLLQCTVASLV